MLLAVSLALGEGWFPFSLSTLCSAWQSSLHLTSGQGQPSDSNFALLSLMLQFSYVSTATTAAAASKLTSRAGWRECLFTGFHTPTVPHACRKHATTTLLGSLQICCSSLACQARCDGERETVWERHTGQATFTEQRSLSF